MQKKLFSNCLLVLIIFLSSCKVNVNSNRPEGAIEAMILRSELAGCTWLIQTEAGLMLEPDKIEDEFQKDKLKVWVAFQTAKGRMSVCMGGKPVIISYINKR